MQFPSGILQMPQTPRGYKYQHTNCNPVFTGDFRWGRPKIVFIVIDKKILGANRKAGPAQYAYLLIGGISCSERVRKKLPVN